MVNQPAHDRHLLHLDDLQYLEGSADVPAFEPILDSRQLIACIISQSHYVDGLILDYLHAVCDTKPIPRIDCSVEHSYD